MSYIRVASILVHKNKILLMGRRKNNKSYFTFPGGHLEEGETMGQGLMRELKEETSIDAMVAKQLYRLIYADGNEVWYFLCAYQSGQPALDPNSSEFKNNSPENYYDPQWIDVEKLPETLLYPLEVRDWLIHDIKNGLPDMPRTEHVVFENMRQA